MKSRRPPNKKTPPRRRKDSIRPEIVQRAKLLVNDPNYPGPEIMRSIARLLAEKFTRPPSARRRPRQRQGNCPVATIIK